ncbi:MAG: helix-turn-helix domain-containing protein [Oscillospiraceae bacterium]
MNILLVDDDVDVIEGMLDAIDFGSVGIDRVYSAHNIFEAKRVIIESKIQIMVTDIEMPNGSGLELLEWVCKENLDLITLFCTCYADFTYAKKALQLRCFDYFLKPIAYSDLTQRLSAAVEAAGVLQASRNTQYQLEKLTETARVEFWKALLLENRSLPPPTNYRADSRFLFCITDLQDSSGVVPAWKKYGCENICAELWKQTTGLIPETFFRFEDNLICTVLQKNTVLISDEEGCKKMMACLDCNLQLISNFYLSEPCALSGAQEEFSALLAIERDDITSKKRLWKRKDYPLKTFDYSLPRLSEWELLLDTGQDERLRTELNSFVDQLASQGAINQAFAKALRIDIVQCVHNVLTNHQIIAHQLFHDETFDRLRSASLRSTEDLKRYLGWVVKRTAEHLSFAKHTNSVVGKVKEYIGTHLEEELCRTELAKPVFLNPDYLARIFKDECGISLGAYIQELRVHEAKRLLLETQLSINVVAQRVGYDNFSHFSQLFKKRTGLSPNEFRNTQIEV